MPKHESLRVIQEDQEKRKNIYGHREYAETASYDIWFNCNAHRYFGLIARQ